VNYFNSFGRREQVSYPGHRAIIELGQISGQILCNQQHGAAGALKYADGKTYRAAGRIHHGSTTVPGCPDQRCVGGTRYRAAQAIAAWQMSSKRHVLSRWAFDYLGCRIGGQGRSGVSPARRLAGFFFIVFLIMAGNMRAGPLPLSGCWRSECCLWSVRGALLPARLDKRTCLRNRSG